MTFSPLDPIPKLTMEERWDAIQFLTGMIVADFGTQEGPYNPLDPGDRARHAMVEIAAAYAQFGEVDDIAEDILERWRKGEIDSDNLEPVDV